MIINIRPHIGNRLRFRLAIFHALILLLALALPYGCSSSDSGGDKGTDGDDGDWADDIVLDSCGFSDLPTAIIEVSINSDVFHSGIYPRIEGLVQENPHPSFHTVFMEEGNCRYLKRLGYGNCDPPCGEYEVCTDDDECVLMEALEISGGTLTIKGLGYPIKIEPEQYRPGIYYGPGGLPTELFRVGDPVGASLAGDEFPALDIGALGVSVMDDDLTNNGFEMVDGQDAEITWTPGSESDSCIQVMLFGYNEAHGAPLPDIIWCEGPDTGSLVIPQAFVEEFPTGETPEATWDYEWPHSELTRYTRSTQETEKGLAQIVVRSTAYFLANHTE